MPGISAGAAVLVPLMINPVPAGRSAQHRGRHYARDHPAAPVTAADRRPSALAQRTNPYVNAMQLEERHPLCTAGERMSVPSEDDGHRLPLSQPSG